MTVKMAASGDPGMSVARRAFTFLVVLLECCIYGGMVFGWPQLVLVLKQEGIFADLCGGVVLNSTGLEDNVTSGDTAGGSGCHGSVEGCGDATQAQRWQQWKRESCEALLLPNDTSDPSSMSGTQICVEQDEQFAFVYTVGVVMYALPSILVGYLLHYAGLWVVRLLACAMLVASFSFFALLNPDRDQLLLPALVLLAMGGNQLRLCAVQFGELFPKRRATALNLLMGSYSVSSSVVYIFQVIADAGLPRSLLCWTFAGMSCVSLLATFSMPRRHVSDAMTALAHTEPSAVTARLVQKNAPTPPTVKLKISLLSMSSGLHIYWLFTSLFALNIYQQLFNFWVTTSSCTTWETKRYTAMFSFCGVVGAFVAPVLGHITDTIITRARRTISDAFMLRVEEICSHFTPLLITTSAALLMFSCLLVFRSWSIYLSLVGLVFCRSCIFSTSTAFLRARFPVEHMDRLMGIYNTIAAILTWSVYPFFIWGMHNYYAATITGLCFIILNVSYPIHLLFRESIRRALLELPQPKSIQKDTLLHRAPPKLMNNNP